MKAATPPVPNAAFVLVGFVAIVYASCAVAPLVPDETYYLAWSNELQLGYVDHPPMIAYVLALSHVFGNSAFAARVPIVALEAIAALALGRATRLLGGSALAALLACGACALLPTERWIAVHALPDAPYLAGWALSLAGAAALRQRATPTRAVLLGFALAFTVLSRTFGWALVAGIVFAAYFDDERRMRRMLPIVLTVVAVAIVPWLVWNAHHGWANVVFTTVGRTHVGFRTANVTRLATIRASLIALSALALAWFTTVRTRRPLLGWTSIPAIALFMLLAPVYRIESYFLLGPLLSLVIALALSLDSARRATLRRTLVVLWCLAWLITLPAAIVPALPAAALATVERAAGSKMLAVYAGEASRLTRLTAVLRDARPGPLDAAPLGASEPIVTDTLAVAAPVTRSGLTVALFGKSSQACEWNAFAAIRSALATPIDRIWFLSDYAPREFRLPVDTYALRRTSLRVPDDIGRIKVYALDELAGNGVSAGLCRTF